MFRPAGYNVKNYLLKNKENEVISSNKENGTIILETKLKAMKTTNNDHRTENLKDDGWNNLGILNM